MPERRVHHHGPQVGVRAQQLPQGQEPSLRASSPLRRGQRRVTHGAQQHGIGLHHRVGGRGWKGITGSGHTRGSDGVLLHRQREAVDLGRGVEHAHGFRGDLRADPVTRQHRDRVAAHAPASCSSARRRRSKCCDGRLLEQRPADLVQPAEQHVAAIVVHLESGDEALAIAHEPVPEVDRELVPVRRPRRAAGEHLHVGIRQHDRQQSVLAAVVVEDVGVRRRDDRAESVVGQCPGRVLARAAATEVGAGDQNRRAGRLRTIELELGIGRAVRAVAPIEEQRRPEAGALDPFEKLLRNDLVGVDVRAWQCDGATGVRGEGLHTLVNKNGDARWRRSRYTTFDEVSNRFIHNQLLVNDKVHYRPVYRPGSRRRSFAAAASPAQIAPHVDQPSFHRGGHRHDRTHEVRASALALPPFEIPIRRRGAALARTEDVVVHAETHGAAGIAPLEARLREDPIETLELGLLPSPVASRAPPWRGPRRRRVGRAPPWRPRAGPRCARSCTSRETRDRP